MVAFDISDYIAAGSLLVAVIALVKSFVADKKLKDLDIKLKKKELQHHEADEEESKKADIEVEVIETGPRQGNRLQFYNKGEATAFNVQFGIPSDDGVDEITLRMSPDYLPYPKLLSSQSFEIPYVYFGSKPHQTIVITWDDEYSKGRRKEMVVDM